MVCRLLEPVLFHIPEKAETSDANGCSVHLSQCDRTRVFLGEIMDFQKSLESRGSVHYSFPVGQSESRELARRSSIGAGVCQSSSTVPASWRKAPFETASPEGVGPQV